MVFALSNLLIELHMVGARSRNGNSVQGVPVGDIMIKTAKINAVPIGVQSFRKHLCVYGFARLLLVIGGAIGVGPDPAPILHENVQQTRVEAPTGRDQDIFLKRICPTVYSIFHLIQNVRFF